MAALRGVVSTRRRLVVALVVPMLVLAAGTARVVVRTGGPAAPVVLVTSAVPGSALMIPPALAATGLGLRAGPVDVPLELHIPSIGVAAPVAGVGITRENVMDAPLGAADDPVWGKGFWYRGSGVPGSHTTAVIAGHVNDARGRPAVFADLEDLRPGDPVVVRDTRTGLAVRFSTTQVETYSLEEAGDPDVLSRIYGDGPVAGTGPLPSADGLAHLTLITCAGTYRGGTHDHRLVVYATRVA